MSCGYFCPSSQAILVLISSFSATFFACVALSWTSWIFCLSVVTMSVFSCVWLTTVASFKAFLTHIRINQLQVLRSKLHITLTSFSPCFLFQTYLNSTTQSGFDSTRLLRAHIVCVCVCMCVNSMLLVAVASKLVRRGFSQACRVPDPVPCGLCGIASCIFFIYYFFYYNTFIVEVWQQEHGGNEYTPEIESKRRDK